PERRTRLRRSGRKRSQHRARKRTQAPSASSKTRKRSFPGALFGFGPAPPKDTAAPKTGDAEAVAPKKRLRRKKKSAKQAAKKAKPAKSTKKR
ncbi:MAG: hypothetical protein R3274_12105, partial [Desulfobacterales bacterium]|nr:hypothetical protein [Desulfobacterales bacterium]